MMPHNERLQSRLTEHLAGLERQGRRRERRVCEPISSTECRIGDKTCIQFASNDYLGLSFHPEVREAFVRGASAQTGARASALVCGRSASHERLEAELARFESTEAALLFPSGYATNIGTIACLVRSQDAVFCDRDNHASIVDGCRHSSGKMFVYRHRELDQLSSALEKRRREFEDVYLVTDSVFSMDGVIAPLQALTQLAEQFECTLIVDEAHGTGVFGEHGRGACEMLGVEDRVGVRIGTLSKAVGQVGGFTAGSTKLIEWLWNSARSQFFSTALPPAVCEAAIAALKVIHEGASRRERLKRLWEFSRQRIQELDLLTIMDGTGPIVPVILGDDQLAVSVSARLLNAGFFVPAIRPPTVMDGTARLRLSLCADHSQDQLNAVLTQIRRTLDAK